MNVASTLFHMLGALRRAIGRVIIFFLLFFLVGAGIVEGGSFLLKLGFLGLGTNIAAVVIGLLLGYTAALTVLVGEAISFLIRTIRGIDKDVTAEISSGEKILETVAKAVASRI